MVPIAACLAAVLLLSACADGPSGGVQLAPPGDVDITGSWQLESGSVAGQALPLVDGHRITLTVQGSRFGGTAACNDYGGTIRIEAAAISVSEIAATDMGCAPEVMRSEQAYLSALGRSQTAARDGETLMLSGPDAQLRFAALPPVPVADVIDTEWVLTTLVDGDVASSPDGGEATLQLSANGTLSGATGCRTFDGTYAIRGDEVMVTQLSVDGHCPAHLADQDEHVLDVVGDGFRAKVNGNRLVAASSGGRRLVYRPR